MKYTDYVGIDVSQKTLDVVLRSTGKHMRVANTEAGMTKMLKRQAGLEEVTLRAPGAHRGICFSNSFSRLSVKVSCSLLS
jgi:ABC-type taurine transport system ATPase subunit